MLSRSPLSARRSDAGCIVDGNESGCAWACDDGLGNFDGLSGGRLPSRSSYITTPIDQMSLRGSVVLDVAGRRSRAMLDSLSERLDDAEKDLQEGRRLQERVGALTDLVKELLLPAEQQDTELLARSLREYRGDSL